MAEPIRGQPDWGGSQPRQFSNVAGPDLEVAARNNWVFAPAARGEVFFHEGFEAANLHWRPYVAQAGNSISLATTKANSGEQSVRLKAINGTTEWIHINRAVARPLSPRIGLGFYFNPKDSWGKFGAYWELGIGGHLKNIDFTYDFTTYKLSVYTGPTTEYVLGTVRLDWYIVEQWYWTQIVADLETEKYVRLYFASQRYDLDLPLENNSFTYKYDVIAGGLYAKAAGGGNADMYFDDVIYTQNEQ